MKDFKEITDQEIRDLLRQRLLNEEDHTDLTKKIFNMEMKRAFTSEISIVPSVDKEVELLNKLNSTKRSIGKWWLLSFIIASILSVFFFLILPENKVLINNRNEEMVLPLTQINNTEAEVVEENESFRKPDKENNGNISFLTSDSTNKALNTEQQIIEQPEEKTITGLASNLPESTKKLSSIEVPTLTPKQVEANNKLKSKMIKLLLKKDSRNWVRIPTSTDAYNGETVSVASFFMSSKEVTNQEYRVFLNDLIIEERFDDYRQAIPDTSKWLISNTGSFFEPMVKNYLWHPAYNEYPVVNVSRKGAELFCKWLTGSVNKKIEKDNPKEKWNSLYINDVRIPQDVEWVIAARGGLHAVAYPWGGDRIQNAKGCFLANFNIKKSEGKLSGPGDCSKPGTKAFTSAGTILGDGWSTAPVDGYSPNKFGLYGMSGNIAEMVWTKDKTAGTKGGSWNSDCEHLKIDAEDEYKNITEASPFIGFRPVFTEKVE